MSERYNVNNNYSLYIPAIGNMTQEQISRVFWEKCVGIVSRVDYFQNVSGLWCAFVHFESVNNNSIVDIISNEILTHGSYQLWFNDCEYLILRMMTCEKIAETHLNIHQIAARLEENDEYILGLQNASNDDKNKIALLEGHVAGLQYNSRRDQRRIKNLEFQLHRLRDIVLEQRHRITECNNRDAEMEKMVTSLVGPRWTEDDEIDAMSPVFVSCNESKVDDDDDDDGGDCDIDLHGIM
jgi:hypothetical protein